jgi:hypothetical protein
MAIWVVIASAVTPVAKPEVSTTRPIHRCSRGLRIRSVRTNWSGPSTTKISPGTIWAIVSGAYRANAPSSGDDSESAEGAGTRPKRLSVRRVTIATLMSTSTSVESHSRRTSVAAGRLGGASILAVMPGEALPEDQREWPSVPAGNMPRGPLLPVRTLPRQD